MLPLRPATAADSGYARQVKHAAYRGMVMAQLQVVEFAIDFARQNRGIGSKVLSRFLEMARAKGKLAQLNVMKTNVKARAMYEKLGFVVYAENENQYALRYAEDKVAELASARLKAALAAGTHPKPEQVETLLARCAVEPDFYVRDMLTWALTRHPPDIVVPRLLATLQSTVAQARSQALHTLSKIRDASTWSAITPSLLHDADDEVAKSAWRAAVMLVPDDERTDLAAQLVSQLGRGDRQMQLSLSRALLAVGTDAVEPVLQEALASEDPAVRAHAAATRRLLRDPDSAFDVDIDAAKRTFTLTKP